MRTFILFPLFIFCQLAVAKPTTDQLEAASEFDHPRRFFNEVRQENHQEMVALFDRAGRFQIRNQRYQSGMSNRNYRVYKGEIYSYGETDERKVYPYHVYKTNNLINNKAPLLVISPSIRGFQYPET